MPIWKTDSIISDLKTLHPLIIDVENTGPDGGSDTDNILVTVKGDGHFYVCGFDEEDDIVDTSFAEVELVQVSDGEDSRGGLNRKDFESAQAYIYIRQYFINKGFEVVNTIDDYF